MTRSSPNHTFGEASISALQGDAWAAWNASYYAEDREAYRNVSRALYRQDVSDRISALFDRLDEQNVALDALLHQDRAA